MIYFHISNAAFLRSAATMTDWVVAKKMQGFQTNSILWKRNADKTLFMKSYKTFSIFVNKGNKCDWLVIHIKSLPTISILMSKGTKSWQSNKDNTRGNTRENTRGNTNEIPGKYKGNTG